MMLKGSSMMLKGSSMMLKGSSAMLKGSSAMLKGSSAMLKGSSMMLRDLHRNQIPVKSVSTTLNRLRSTVSNRGLSAVETRLIGVQWATVYTHLG
jgi:hypothetical protein